MAGSLYSKPKKEIPQEEESKPAAPIPSTVPEPAHPTASASPPLPAPASPSFLSPASEPTKKTESNQTVKPKPTTTPEQILKAKIDESANPNAEKPTPKSFSSILSEIISRISERLREALGRKHRATSIEHRETSRKAPHSSDIFSRISERIQKALGYHEQHRENNYPSDGNHHADMSHGSSSHVSTRVVVHHHNHHYHHRMPGSRRGHSGRGLDENLNYMGNYHGDTKTGHGRRGGGVMHAQEVHQEKLAAPVDEMNEMMGPAHIPYMGPPTATSEPMGPALELIH